MDMEFLQRTIDENTERFQGQNHGLGQSAPQGTYMTPGGYRRARQGLIAVIFMPIMYRIAQNWYERTGDWKLALGKAAIVVWYWKAWFFGCFAWFLMEMAGGYWGMQLRSYQDQTGVRPVTTHWQIYCWLVWTVGFIPLFFVYTKLVDQSLFKQRLMYRVINLPGRFIHWLPWPVLLSMVMIPMFYLVSLSVPSSNPPPPAVNDDSDVPVPGVYDVSTGAVLTNVVDGVETGVVYDPSTGAVLSGNR